MKSPIVYDDVRPFDHGVIWGGDLPDEPIELLLARALETAKRYALQVPAWASHKDPYMQEGHAIMPSVTYMAFGHYGPLGDPLTAEAYCMNIGCSWGVVMKGKDCEARLQRAIDEHLAS